MPAIRPPPSSTLEIARRYPACEHDVVRIAWLTSWASCSESYPAAYRLAELRMPRIRPCIRPASARRWRSRNYSGPEASRRLPHIPLPVSPPAILAGILIAILPLWHATAGNVCRCFLWQLVPHLRSSWGITMLMSAVGNLLCGLYAAGEG